MIVLGVDTATRSTAVALRLADGRMTEARDDPNPTHPGRHPGHTTRLLEMADELLARAGIGWSALERIAVGLGPGTFTGLRVGVATARGLAQTLGIELVGVSSLRALAEPRLRSESAGRRVLAVLDARRGEAFAAAYEMTDRGSIEELTAPEALAPEELGGVVAALGGELEAIGNGAMLFRDQLQDAGVTVPPDSAPAHLLSAAAICDLGARVEAVAPLEAVVPDYRRRPDAEIALERARALAGTQVSSVAQAGEGAGS